MSLPSPSRAAQDTKEKVSFALMWRRWWRQQTPVLQDTVAMLVPLLAVLLFLAAIVSTFWYLRAEEADRAQESLVRDLEYTQQRLRLRLLERQAQLMRLARDMGSKEITSAKFTSTAESLVNQFPELQSVSWIDRQQRVKATYAASRVPPAQRYRAGQFLSPDTSAEHDTLVREQGQPVFSLSMTDDDRVGVLQLHIPLSSDGQFTGMVLGEFSIDGLLHYTTQPEVQARYVVSLRDSKGRLLAGEPELRTPQGGLLQRLSWAPRATNTFEIPVSPVGNTLMLRAQVYQTSQGMVGNGLFGLVVALSVLAAWMLVANWRHTRRRQQAQQALIAETNFRRAMENSMITGMRALDLQGRITYVNAAFCQMTGWSESDLVGRMPPFPYWVDAEHDLMHKRLEDELKGILSPSGTQVRVKRKNGTIFDARLYVSPLVDARGQQSGWMASMTDITEPTRIRQQLSASHERFTTVLEAIDAAISVAPIGSRELLFANKLYRHWFSAGTVGHLDLVAQAQVSTAAVRHENDDEADDGVDALAGLPQNALTDAQPANNEIFVPELGRWLEVRSRYLTWVDGRLAQMVIATDITARRDAEEQAAAQLDRAHATSRLVTMGEMASSVAHELNQPLTAINNYCNGMISRLRDRQINTEALLAPLEKTVRQAQRAGQIIQRIRSLVKRSEPNWTTTDVPALVSEAIELSSIELRRRNVRLNHYVAARLPLLMADPIMIEQVLINLLRNAAEAIDLAQRAVSERIIELRALPKLIEGQETIEFSVQDTGTGIAPEVMARLFDAFFSTKPEGMGIGLNLCRTIVEAHRGRMEAQNIYNGRRIVGCRFSFWIPVLDAMKLAANEEAKAST